MTNSVNSRVENTLLYTAQQQPEEYVEGGGG